MPQKQYMRRLALGAAIGSLCLPAAMAQEVPTLAPVQVQGQDVSTPLQPTPAQAQARLSRVPGGTNLIEPGNEVRSITLRDALDYQPGHRRTGIFRRHRPAAPEHPWVGHPEQPGQSRRPAAAGRAAAQ